MALRRPNGSYGVLHGFGAPLAIEKCARQKVVASDVALAIFLYDSCLGDTVHSSASRVESLTAFQWASLMSYASNLFVFNAEHMSRVTDETCRLPNR